jgi:hypothetical protein
MCQQPHYTSLHKWHVYMTIDDPLHKLLNLLALNNNLLKFVNGLPVNLAPKLIFFSSYCDSQHIVLKNFHKTLLSLTKGIKNPYCSILITCHRNELTTLSC